MQNARSKDERSKGARDNTSFGSRPQPTEDSAGRKVKGSRRRDSNVTMTEKSTRKGKRAALTGPTVWRPRVDAPPTLINPTQMEPTSQFPAPAVRSDEHQRSLGERIYREVSRFLPHDHVHLAGRITGMFLEKSDDEITFNMRDDRATIQWINEALEVLNQSCRIDERPYTLPSLPSAVALPLKPKPKRPLTEEEIFADPPESETEREDEPYCSRAAPASISSLLSSLPSSSSTSPTTSITIPSQTNDSLLSPHNFTRIPAAAELIDRFDSPPAVQQVVRDLDFATLPPDDIHIPIRRRPQIQERSVTATLSQSSQEGYRHEYECEREDEIDRAVDHMMTSNPYQTFLERVNQAVINFFESRLPLMLNDFMNNKLRYFLVTLSFLILFILTLMSFASNISWLYNLFTCLMLAIIIIVQATGRYVFPDSQVDDLYLYRQYLTIVSFITLVAHLLWSPANFMLINFLFTWLILKSFPYALFTSLHLSIAANWGLLSFPFFIVQLCLIQELIFVRKAYHGVYKHPYLSLSKLKPIDIEKRKTYDYMRKHQQVFNVKDFDDLENDPFFISDATEVMYENPRYAPYHLEEKKTPYRYPDGVLRQKITYVKHSRDVRERAIVPFKDVRVKTPHFYQALMPLSTVRSSNALVCEELVFETIALAYTKFGVSPPADGLTSVMRSMAVQLHYYNLPNSPVLFHNSVSHGYNRYLMILKASQDTQHYLQTTSILMGLENAGYGRFRHRWYLRNFWLPEGHPFRERLAKFVALHISVTLIPIYGYLWRHVPKILQEKTPTATAPRLMAMAGNNSVDASNTSQSVAAWTNNTLLFSISNFLAHAKRKISGYSFLSYAQPLPATDNYDNMIAGINGRLFVGQKKNVTIGVARDYALNELRKTVLDDIDRWEPLADILTKEEWLDLSKNYSLAKKRALLKLEDTGRYFDTFFLKWESYTGFKAPRIISNSDKKFLTIEGPVIKTMEQQLEALPSTLTGIPVADWAKTVFNTLSPYEDNDAFQVYVSDISSFESAITPQIKDATENLVFDRLLTNYPLLARKLRSRQQIRHYYKAMGEDVIEYDYNGRASGDARTYAGNTIVNHYLLYNLYHHFQLIPLPYFVSGDDAIFVLPKSLPASEVEAYYADLGFSVELKETKIANSGFCGFNFEDITFRRVCADPVSTILKFFMTQFPFKLGKYRAYLADQCLCLLHEYPGDPVLRPAVEWMLHNMPHRNENYRTWWQQQLMKDGNQWGKILREEPMSFDTYAQLHPEHTPLFYQELSERFKDAVVSICTHPDQYYARKLEAMIAQIDEGTPREIFNDFRMLDVYGIEYDIDVGYYYPNLELFQARVLGLIETY